MKCAITLLMAFCRGFGLVVVAAALLGAIVPGMNFRMCFGSADRCQLKHEAAIPTTSQEASR